MPIFDLPLKDTNHPELFAVLTRGVGLTPAYPVGQKSGTVYLVAPIDEEPILCLSLDGPDKITRCEYSDNFPLDELDRIRERVNQLVVNKSAQGYGQVLCYCGAPVRSCFWYNDRFRLVPVPASLAIEVNLTSLKPCVLQFSYKRSNLPEVDAMRREREIIITTRLLHLLLNREFKYSQSEIIPGLESELPGFPDDAMSEMEVIPNDVYYKFGGTIHFEPLTVPLSIVESLNIIFSMKPRELNKFERACTWFYQADDIYLQSMSSSFIALVNALESLMDKPKKCNACGQSIVFAEDHCEKCMQPRYGLTQEFHDLVENNTEAIPEFVEAKGLLYKLRSHLVHGIDLLERDIHPWNPMSSMELGSLRGHDGLYGALRYLTGEIIRNVMLSSGRRAA